MTSDGRRSATAAAAGGAAAGTGGPGGEGPRPHAHVYSGAPLRKSETRGGNSHTSHPRIGGGWPCKAQRAAADPRHPGSYTGATWTATGGGTPRLVFEYGELVWVRRPSWWARFWARVGCDFLGHDPERVRDPRLLVTVRVCRRCGAEEPQSLETDLEAWRRLSA